MNCSNLDALLQIIASPSEVQHFKLERKKIGLCSGQVFDESYSVIDGWLVILVMVLLCFRSSCDALISPD